MSDTVFRNGLTPKMRPISPRRSTLVAALDVGTSKVVCMIARLKPVSGNHALRQRSHSVEVLGVGHTRARGMKSGAVVDLAECEDAIRHAVDAAERMAGVQLESVILSLSAGRLGSDRYRAEVTMPRPAVDEGDIHRVLLAGNRHCVRDGRVVLHSLPIGYALDGVSGVRDPRGLLGRRLGVDMHMASADVGPARNLMLAVERGHLAVEAMVAAPYASSLSVLSDDEPDLGVAVVDMGAGTTSIAIYSEGHLAHVDAVAVGGLHVTMDLARGLSTPVADAERIKTLHAAAIGVPSDERDMIAVPSAGEDEREPPNMVSRATILKIARPRVEEILELVRDKIAASGLGNGAGSRIVLTGGASQLTGLQDLAGKILGRQVRIGRPLGISGLPDAAKGPAFAAALGLLVYPQAAYLEHFEGRSGNATAATGTDGYMSRVGRWIRESF